jgi:hypothetical protein
MPLLVGVLPVPVPVRLTVIVFPAEELLAMLNRPAPGPALVGSNCTVSVTDWPGFNLAGNVAPETEKPVPTRETVLISSGHVPEDVNVTDCVAAVFTGILPKAMLVALTLIVDATAVRPMAKVADAPAEFAVKVTFCAAPTADTFAVNPALIAPAATFTVAGTAIAVLLLARFTVHPPLGADPFRFTVHASFPIPVMDALLQLMELRPVAAGVPVPVKLSAMDIPAEELLEMLN